MIRRKKPVVHDIMRMVYLLKKYHSFKELHVNWMVVCLVTNTLGRTSPLALIKNDVVDKISEVK